jgi:hypothetical protein
MMASKKKEAPPKRGLPWLVQPSRAAPFQISKFLSRTNRPLVVRRHGLYDLAHQGVNHFLDVSLKGGLTGVLLISLLQVGGNVGL